MGQSQNPKRNLSQLEEIALKLRLDVVEMVAPTGQGYVQQGLGATDIFTALYFSETRFDPQNPDWADRDRVFLTTAHNTAIFYATLATAGFFGRDHLPSYCRDGSPLEINSSERMGTFVEATCGSLGQGLSVALGTAMSLKRRGSSARVYVILGDGEMQEGQIWEALMAAGGWGIDNLCLILDYNFLQCEGPMDQVISLEPVVDKLASFGFAVQDIDGNDLGALVDAFDKARATKGKPSFLLANTLVGKGVSSLEGVMAHQLKFSPAISEPAIAEIKAKIDLGVGT